MKKPIIMIGLGEMGSVFARAFLRIGHPVIPVTRDMSLDEVAAEITDPQLVMLSVGEADLETCLKQLPDQWRSKLGLLQNELLPPHWQRHDIIDPTVISVWFEKKKGQDSKVILPSPVFGPQAETIQSALASIDISACVLDTPEELLFELVRKNVYILTTNIAGLKVGGTVDELWEENQALAYYVATDVINIQAAMLNETLSSEALIDGMKTAIDGDPEHKCMGRSAPQRLTRALELAETYGVDVPHLKDIQSS